MGVLDRILQSGVLYGTLVSDVPVFHPDDIAGLTSFWPMDETTGTVTYDQKGSNDLGLEGAAAFNVNGIKNGCVDIPSSGRLYLASTTDMNNITYSINTWVRYDSISGGWQTILEYDRSSRANWLWIGNVSGSVGTIRANWSGGGFNSADFNSKLDLDTWYLVTVVVDSAAATATYYVDGLLDRINTGISIPTATVAAFSMGANNDGNEAIDGRLDYGTYYANANTIYDTLNLYNDGPNPLTDFEKISSGRKVLISTDWWTDCDDVLAMRIAAWAHRKGFINIQGLDVCTTYYVTGDPIGAQSLDAMMIHDGVTGNNISICNTDHIPSGSPPYQNNMEANNTHSNTTWQKDTVEKWRTVLAGAADGEMEIITTGFLNSLYEVMASPADGISASTGMELITAKVSKIWIMGGKWATGNEYNLDNTLAARTAAKYVIDNSPVPLTFLGYDIGSSVVSGGNMATQSPADDIVRIAFADHGSSGGRSSWDPMTMLMAVIGDEVTAGYTTVDGTATFVEATGTNSFTVGAGIHKYVQKDKPDFWYKQRLNELAVLTLQQDYVRTNDGNKR